MRSPSTATACAASSTRILSSATSHAAIPLLIERLQATRLQLLDVYRRCSVRRCALHARRDAAASVRGREHRARLRHLHARAGADRGRRHSFLPGQFNMLYAFGVGEVPISISGDPRAAERSCTRFAPSAPVTQAICASRAGRRRRACAARSARPGRVEAAGARSRARRRRPRPGAAAAADLRLARHRERFGRVIAALRRAHPRRPPLPRRARSAGARASTYESGHRRRAGPAGTATSGWCTRSSARARVRPEATRSRCVRPGGDDALRRPRCVERGVPPERDYVSLERNMKCAVGLCGHCQFGPTFVCKDGPVFRSTASAASRGARSCERAAKPEARRLQVRLVRRLPALAARLRGRAAGASPARSRSPTSSRRPGGRRRARTTCRWSKARSRPRTTPSDPRGAAAERATW